VSRRFMNFNISCILILIFAGVFYSIVWRNAPLETSDTPGYVEVAADLRDGKLDELHDRAPGYPILLLATNSLEPSRILFLTQLSLYLLSVLLLVVFLNDAGIPKRFTLLFLLLSLIPPSVVNTAYMLTETLAAFLITAGAIALFWWFRNGRMPAVIVSGLAFALSALVRPAYQLLFVMLTGILLLLLVFTRNGRRRMVVAAVSIFLSSCLVLGGYSLYNRQSFDFFGVSPMLGFNLSTKTVRVIERLPDEYKDIREALISSRDSELTARGGSHTGVMFIWRTIPDLQRLTVQIHAQAESAAHSGSAARIRGGSQPISIDVLAAFNDGSFEFQFKGDSIALGDDSFYRRLSLFRSLGIAARPMGDHAAAPCRDQESHFRSHRAVSPSLSPFLHLDLDHRLHDARLHDGGSRPAEIPYSGGFADVLRAGNWFIFRYAGRFTIEVKRLTKRPEKVDRIIAAVSRNTQRALG
jgi:hypothetical protein